MQAVIVCHYSLVCVSILTQAQPVVTAEDEKEFLGNGEWPYPSASHATSPTTIPLPPQEGVDNAPKITYRMSSRPRL